jgi:predicted nucleic acid-binding Zn ribbon protein
MNLKAILLKYFGWCPMNPFEGRENYSIKKLIPLKENAVADKTQPNLHQICPVCKKLVPETDLVCPYCNASLGSSYEECPFCKNQISEKDTICPHCNELLIYEYPKQVVAKRNKVLFPLGFILLSSLALVVFLKWRDIELSWFVGVLFMAFWLIGFVLYGAYIGKGDKDFWWGN